MPVRIATFNAENLTRRFDFSSQNHAQFRVRKGKENRANVDAHLRRMGTALLKSHTHDTKKLTARAIIDTAADIICLQEVDNIGTLRAFEEDYLKGVSGERYRQLHLVEGNDGRGIDVAIMARKHTPSGDSIEISSVKSHAELTYEALDLVENSELSLALQNSGNMPEERVFRRDCLEVNLTIGGKALTLFVLHQKSMGNYGRGLDGRTETMPIRLAESLGVRQIIKEKFGKEIGKERWLICGDLNDYRSRLIVGGEAGEQRNFRLVEENSCGFDPLIEDGFSENLIARRPADDQWTLYYASKPDVEHLVQLDYILASPYLAKTNAQVIPDIIRTGQPFRTVFPPSQEVKRYARTGWDRPKASDHSPVVVTLELK